MRKMKRTKKKNMGLEARIEREEFLQELKHPKPKQSKQEAKRIELEELRKIAGIPHHTSNRKTVKSKNPYDAGPDGAMGSILEKIRLRKLGRM